MNRSPAGPVLVTGGGGFIGSHLVARAVREYAQVICLRRDASAGGALEGVESRICDLSDADAVRRAIQGSSVVFHLGGMASAADARAFPDRAFRANTVATHNILEASRLSGVEQVVLLSTAHVYGPARYLPLTEDHPVAPGSVYAATKLAADVLALTYHRSYGLSVNILRPFNVYGPRQTADTVIPSIISQAVEGRAVKVRDLRPRRDFLYVDDVVDALLRAAAIPATGQEILLASGLPVSIATLVRTVAGIVTGCAVDTPAEPPDEGDCLFGCSDRAGALLGWKPKVGLHDGLARTIEWWRQQRPLAVAKGQA